MQFKEVSAKLNIPELEEKILKFWKEKKIFEKSVEQRSEDNRYSFYDGPPFITGLPHFGTLLPSIAKDIIPRYQTMKGKRVKRVWGWDCHGLPVEEKTEEKLGLKNRRDIEKIGIDEFIKQCRIYVSETSAEWEWYIDKIARWVDFKNAYKTMDLDYMESVIWAFKQVYDKGLIYQGFKTLLYCTRCGTPVSKFEIAMDDSYADMQDPAITIEFPITSKGEFEGKRILAWTTTPWTLPANRGLVVDENEDYVEFQTKGSDKIYIMAKKIIEGFLKGKEYRVLREFKGKELLGLSYQAPYDYFPPNENDLKVYQYEGMVNMEEGTGIVHSAPGFGEIDTEMGKHYGLTLMSNIDDEGKFTNEVKDFAKMYVKDADSLIVKDLKKKDVLFKQGTITHRYPYCYRCETPLIYRAVEAWFVDIQKIKKDMLRLNQNIHWVPEHFKEGRFRYTVEEAPDWCVSRTRYWATVMPIWKCEKCEALKVVGSIKEIEENSIKKVKITDLHRTGVDHIKFKCEKCGGEMRRIPEVLDCWFESGSMPYAEWHYPFENKELFEKAFPADYIVEYVGQVRAWFYYLHALSTILFDSNCFKNVVVTGNMAGTDGRKMSKSYGNYPDPREVLETYGGDALRLYLMGSKIMSGRDINITKGDELLDQVKTVLLPLWNSYNFFTSFANFSGWEPDENIVPGENLLNKWIVSRVNQFHIEFSENMDKYYVPEATGLVQSFLEDLSRWYIRRSRKRLKAGDKDALATFYWVLVKAIKTMAPLIPFITEEIYQNLSQGKLKESIHLESWPQKGEVNQELLEKMELVRIICGLGHAIRKRAGVKVRQPLALLKLKTQNSKLKTEKELLNLIKDELNVKEVQFVEGIQTEKDWVIEKENDIEIALKIEITKELKEEGMVREIIRSIQQMRKEAGLKPVNKISIQAFGSESLNKILKRNKDFICKQTIAQDLEVAQKTDQSFNLEKEVKIDNTTLWLAIEKE